MTWTYVCPRCGGLLNPHQTLVLLAEHEGRRMLAGFHPEPGNYEVYLPPDVRLKSGDLWSFFCPICRQNLVTKENENLCSVVMLEEDTSRRVLFSRVAGEKATYIVYDQQIVHRHGKHQEHYAQTLVPIRQASSPSAEGASSESTSTPQETGPKADPHDEPAVDEEPKGE